MMIVAFVFIMYLCSSASAFGQSDCPCSDPSLCKPITRTGGEGVYVFHTKGTENWRQYDWEQITTVCVFGALDPEMLCHAHAHNARVTFGVGAIATKDWSNDTVVTPWISSMVQKVKENFADGVNLDIEVAVNKETDINALTKLSARVAEEMHKEVPGSHVTFDTASLGLLEEGGCGKQYGRDYDFKALANVLDFLVVMDYDSNDYGRDCETCFYANDALPVVAKGIECYQSLGVPTSKLVVAFPWYGYDYTCTSPGDVPGGVCHVTKAVQVNFPAASGGIVRASKTGDLRWDTNSSTPYYFYYDNTTTSTEGTLHRVDFDDIRSLSLKYALVKKMKVRGVGMWTADSIDYSNETQVTAFWNALKVFTGNTPIH